MGKLEPSAQWTDAYTSEDQPRTMKTNLLERETKVDGGYHDQTEAQSTRKRDRMGRFRCSFSFLLGYHRRGSLVGSVVLSRSKTKNRQSLAKTKPLAINYVI